MEAVLKKYLEKVVAENRLVDARGVMQVQRMIELEMDEIFVSLTALTISDKLTIDFGTSNTFIPYNRSRVVSPYVPIYKYLGNFRRLNAKGIKAREQAELPFLEEITEAGLSLDELWQRNVHWVLLGDPGSGKTTVQKHLSYHNAKAFLQSGEGWFPVLITLRFFAHEWNKNHSWSVGDALIHYIAGPLLEDMGFNLGERNDFHSRFESLLSDGKVLLLLDGLDEQREPEMKKRTAAAVEDLLMRARPNRCLVTSRIIGYEAAPLRLDFSTATLEPFTPEQMKEFFVRWMKAVERREDIVFDASTERRAEGKAEELVEQIQAHPGIKTLAANPLLCTVIGLIQRQGGGTLPQQRVELYKLCIDTFIFNWEMHKRRKGIEQESLDKDETQAALEVIALFLHEDTEENRAPRGRLSNVVSTFLVLERGLSEQVAHLKAERLLDLIRDVAGLLIDKGNDEYGFFHLTFQEYLTARAITQKKKDIDRYLSMYLFNPRWREVIYLAAAHQGMKDEETGSEFIKAVMRHKHEHEKEMRYAFRLAFKCMLDARVELGTSDEMVKQWVELYLKHPHLSRMLLRLFNDYRGGIHWRSGSLGPLLKALEDKDTSVRRSAAEALGRLQAKEAVRPLIKTLEDKDMFVRSNATDALSRLQVNEVMGLIIKALEDESISVRESAAQALGRLQAKEAVGPLIKALEDESISVRESAAQALGRLQAKEAVGPLIKALEDESISVRSSAADALGRFQATEVVGPLIKVLEDDAKSVRESAAQALERLQATAAVGPLIKALEDESISVRLSAAEALGRLQVKESLGPLIKALEDKHEFVRNRATNALGRLQAKEAVGPLIKALEDKTKSVREGAAHALGLLQEKEAVEPLIKALEDESNSVRGNAAQSLAMLQAKKAVRPLLKALEDKDDFVSSSAAETLGTLQAKEAAGPLIKALEHKEAYVRMKAAYALAKLQAKEAVGPLIKALEDKHEFVRYSAVSALAEIQATEAVEPLIRTLEDVDDFTRRNAASALGTLQAKEAVLPLIKTLEDESNSVREIAAASIEMIEMGSHIL